MLELLTISAGDGRTSLRYAERMEHILMVLIATLSPAGKWQDINKVAYCYLFIIYCHQSNIQPAATMIVFFFSYTIHCNQLS